MAKKRRKRITCPNCDKQLREEMNFCFNCGQENHIKRVTVKMLVEDFSSTYFSFDSKLFQSIKYLLIKPSFLSLEYLNGKIEAYLRPIRLYVFISFVFFVLFGLTTNDNIVDGISSVRMKSIENIDSDFDSESSNMINVDGVDFTEQLLGKQLSDKSKQIFSNKHEMENFFNYLKSKLPILLFLIIPVLGFILFLGFYKKGYYYVDHLVFALHLQSFAFVLLIVTTLFNWVLKIDLEDYVILVVLIYGFIAAKKFYKRSMLSTFLRLTFVGFFHIIISMLALTTFFLLAMQTYTV